MMMLNYKRIPIQQLPTFYMREKIQFEKQDLRKNHKYNPKLNR